MNVEVPEQPLFFSDMERPVTSLEINKRQSKSKSHKMSHSKVVFSHADTASKHAPRHHAVTSRHDVLTSRRHDVTSRDDAMTSLHDAVTSEPTTKKNRRRYNLRRLNELPFHLVRCRRTELMFEEVLHCLHF